jgi:Flp pilus assembly protein TadG
MMRSQDLAYRILGAGSRYGADRRGAAAAEFALVLGLLVIPLLNVIDLGTYVFQRMELENATQVAAQAAWATCSLPANLPATPNSYQKCLSLPTAMTTAVQSTPLGSGVAVTATSEDYKCVSATTGQLVSTGTFPTKPSSNCSPYGGYATDAPGDYILITASYNYAPLFSDVSVASLLTTPIVRTAWMRLG